MSAPTVLKECQRFLRVAQLCKSSPVKFHRFEIPLSVVQCVILFSIEIFMLSLIWFCFEKDFDLKKTAEALHLTLGGSQMMLIYISLAVNNSTIIKIMAEFQDIVDQSW